MQIKNSECSDFKEEMIYKKPEILTIRTEVPTQECDHISH